MTIHSRRNVEITFLSWMRCRDISSLEAKGRATSSSFAITCNATRHLLIDAHVRDVREETEYMVTQHRFSCIFQV